MFPVSDLGATRRSFPFINITLIGICIAVFIYELKIGPLARGIFFYRLGLIPAEIGQGINYKSLLTTLGAIDITSPIPNWATIITSMFIHAGWLHIAGNMLFLWVFGDNIEDRFGHFKYFLFYLAAGAVAVWLQIMTDRASKIPTIGASGAIAGVLGAYLILFPTSKIGTVVTIFVIGFFRIPAIILLGVWFLLQFISGVGSLNTPVQTGGIAYWAHIGGFSFGIIIGIVYRIISHIKSRPPRYEGPRGPETPIRDESTKYWRGRPV